MFVIRVTYTKPIEEIDRFLQEHRQYLEVKYQQGLLVCSGPQNPRIGGIIIARTMERDKLEKLIEQDPFSREKVALYEIIEFTPVKMDAGFSGAFSGQP